MAIINNLIALFSDYTVQIVFLGSVVLGITAGCLGAFAVLRQQSLLGDAISHATLPGVALMFLITQSKNNMALLIGASLAGWIGTIFVKIVVENTRIKKDTALGIVLSVFFGFGLMLLTIVQKLPTATKAGLDKFLFGNAATLLKGDVILIVWVSVVIIFTLLLCWKEFKIIVFDAEYAKSLGLNVHLYDILLTTLTVGAIVIGLQLVGVVLMSAMLVAPAAAARQWTDRLGVMVFLSALFGSVSGFAGSLSSSLINNLPTGPTIVVFLSIIVFVSLFFAPHRGLLGDWIRVYRTKEKILTTSMLKNLLLFSEIGTDPYHAHDIAALNAIGRGTVKKTMMELSKKGLVVQPREDKWAFTEKGLKVARKITKEYEEQFNVNTSG